MHLDLSLLALVNFHLRSLPTTIDVAKKMPLGLGTERWTNERLKETFCATSEQSICMPATPSPLSPLSGRALKMDFDGGMALCTTKWAENICVLR